MLKADREKRLPPNHANRNEIVLRRVTELRFDPLNSVEHGGENLEQIRQSLLLYGQVEPLTIQRGTSRIIGGHGRVTVMLEEGWEWAECIERDLTDAEATDLNIRLNSAPKLSTWNTDNLAEIAMQGDVDLEAIFGGEELSQILTGVISGDPSDDSFSLPDFEAKATDFIEGYADGERKGKHSANQSQGNYSQGNQGTMSQPDRFPDRGDSENGTRRRIACPNCGLQFNPK